MEHAGIYDRSSRTILPRHMHASAKRQAEDQADPDGADRPDSDQIASDRDAAGTPIHRGWAPAGGRRRWMEPFVLVLLAGGGAHGYAIIAQLEEMGITGTSVDIGQVYRTLRDLEEAGHVTSQWSDDPSWTAAAGVSLDGQRLRRARRVGGGHEGADAPDCGVRCALLRIRQRGSALASRGSDRLGRGVVDATRKNVLLTR